MGGGEFIEVIFFGEIVDSEVFVMIAFFILLF